MLSAIYIIVSGFGESYMPAVLFAIAPIAIAQVNLVTKLAATKVLVPLLAKYIRHRSESQYTATVLLGTFAVETMQTAFLITASFAVATYSSRPCVIAHARSRTLRSRAAHSRSASLPFLPIQVF